MGNEQVFPVAKHQGGGSGVLKEEMLALFKNAERSIRNAEKTMADGDLDFAASRAYYAMFYVADGLHGEKDCTLANTAALMAPLGSISSEPASLTQSINVGWWRRSTKECSEIMERLLNLTKKMYRKLSNMPVSFYKLHRYTLTQSNPRLQLSG